MTNNFVPDAPITSFAGRYTRIRMTGRYAFHVHDWKDCDGQHTGRQQPELGPQKFTCTKWEQTEKFALRSGDIVEIKSLTILQQGESFKTATTNPDLTSRDSVVE